MSGIGNRRGAPAKHGRTELHDNEKHDDGEHNRRKHPGQGHPHEHTPLGLQDLRSFRVHCLAGQDNLLHPTLPVPARRPANGGRRHRIADANCSVGFRAQAILAGTSVQHVAIGMVKSVCARLLHSCLRLREPCVDDR